MCYNNFMLGITTALGILKNAAPIVAAQMGAKVGLEVLARSGITPTYERQQKAPEGPSI
jgi:hypothetical protein